MELQQNRSLIAEWSPRKNHTLQGTDTPWEKQHHLQNGLGKGYVSCPEVGDGHPTFNRESL